MRTKRKSGKQGVKKDRGCKREGEGGFVKRLVKGQDPFTVIGSCILILPKRLWLHLEMYTGTEWKKRRIPESVGDQPEGRKVVRQKD